MVHLRARSPFAAIAGAALLLSAAASADGVEETRQLDAEARALFERGSYVEAARAFESVFQRSPRASTEYNVALSWDRAGEAARAADAFEASLELPALDATRARASEQRLSELRLRLGYVVARRPLGALITVLHVHERPVPSHFHVPPGEHIAQLKLRDGRTIEAAISVRAGKSVELAVDAPADEPGARAPRPPAPAPPVDARTAKGSGASIWPWAALGASAVFSGTAIGLGVRTLNERDAYVAEHPYDTSARDRVIALRNWTDAAWGAAIVTGAIGVTLLVLRETSRGRGAGPARASSSRFGF